MNGEVRHLPQIRGEEEFTEEDHVLLDYACILTGYMKALPAASEGISTLMGNAYRGIRPATNSKGYSRRNGMASRPERETAVLKRISGISTPPQASGNACGIVSWTRRICRCLSLLTMFAKVTEQLEEIIGFGDDDMIMGISGLLQCKLEMDQALERHAIPWKWEI